MEKVSASSIHHLRNRTAYLCLLTPLNCEEHVVSPVGKRGLRRLLVALCEAEVGPPLDGRLLHISPSVSLQLSSSTGSSVDIVLSVNSRLQAVRLMSQT